MNYFLISLFRDIFSKYKTMEYIFDTHCHPNLNKIKNKTEIIDNFFKNWGKYMNIIWTNPQTNKSVIEISNNYDWIFCSIWIHPCDIYDLNLKKEILNMEKHINNKKNKIVAIWECWLDYYWLKPENNSDISALDLNKQKDVINQKKELQKQFFKAQLKLANKYNLPVIIHNRESKDDIFKILKEIDFKNFIFHCYSENLEYAKQLINFAPNCKISFSWIVTFKNAKEIQETVKNIDLKHILAETDSPYLTPSPYRWKEENEPIYTKYIIEKIEKLRWKKCSKQIFNNSIEIFSIKG